MSTAPHKMIQVEDPDHQKVRIWAIFGNKTQPLTYNKFPYPTKSF